MCATNLTGKPNVDQPWLKYYPKELLENLKVPDCTLNQYMYNNMTGIDDVAIDFYGNSITWRTFFRKVEQVARGLRAAGFQEGDQVPVLIKSIPEFFYLLFACERIGASLLIRDNEVHENADAIRAAGVDTMFASDCIAQAEIEQYMATTKIKKVILIPLTNSCVRDGMPMYVQMALDKLYDHECTHGEAVITWSEFLAAGEHYEGVVDAPVDLYRPLFRCYTSGSTGPSKQVIHAAHTIIGALTQLNFYAPVLEHRLTWLVSCLPPCLVSVVISFLLLPLASKKILQLDPFADPLDVDLEIMRYKPNCWPTIPMMVDIVARSKRIPDDYDMSHLVNCGAGCEHMNNTQLHRFQKFLNNHNCQTRFTTGYGSSEAGSNVGFHLTQHPLGNGNVGVPMPLMNVSICKPDTIEELGYNQQGEICVCSPGVMLGYDNEAATADALRVHEDGKVWMHMGDIGYMTEEGILYTASRGSSKRYGFKGGFLDILPMENAVADANIDGIVDEFFANIPDAEHDGYYVPYLYIVLDEGYTVDDVRDQIYAALKPHQIPAVIEVLPERPFWHYKTFRVGMIRKVLEKRSACLNAD